MGRKIVIVVAVVFVGVLTGAAAIGQNPASPSLKEHLDAQYKSSKISTDGSVQDPGTILVIQQSGVQGVPLTDAAMPTAACKDGVLHKPSAGSGFGASLLSGMAQPNSTTSGTLSRPFPVGDKVYLTNINVNLKRDRITFTIAECASCNGTDPSSAYKAAVSFEFAKGSLATKSAPEVEDMIAKVFSIDTGQAQAQPNPPEGALPAPFPGVYTSLISQAQLQFNPDGTFAQHGPGAWQNSGTFTVNGDKVSLMYPSTGLSSTFSIRGGTIYNERGRPVWARQADALAPAAPAAAPAPPPVAPLKLPATYVNAQAPADLLQLGADNSFSLQEAGQAYRGTFVVNGNNLELTIVPATSSESSTKTTATLQGNNLTDSSGQTWVLRDQSGVTPPGGTVLQNEDVIKMAKAGLDDAIIIAKISSSKCQFDTSTDALIKLKQNGVSAAVLKAMVGPGK